MKNARTMSAGFLGLGLFLSVCAVAPAQAQSRDTDSKTVMLGMGVSGEGVPAPAVADAPVVSAPAGGSAAGSPDAQPKPAAKPAKKDKLAQADSDAWQMEFGDRAIQGDRESSKFEEFREVPVGPFMPQMRFERYRDRGMFYEKMRITNMGQVDGRYEFELGDLSKWSFKAYYDKVPQIYSNSGLTPFIREGNQLVLDPGFQAIGQVLNTTVNRNNETAFGIALESQLNRVGLGVQVDVGGFAVDFEPGRDWDVGGSYEQRTKVGAQPSGGTLNGTNVSVEHARPIDTSTQNYETHVAWTGHKGSAEVGYEHSHFHNNFYNYTLANPFRATADTFHASASGGTSVATKGLFVEEPDNDADMLNFNGSWDITKNARVTQATSWGVMTQNEALPAETITAAIMNSGKVTATPGSADARIDTFMDSTRLVYKFGSKTRLDAKYHTWVEDNHTALHQFDSNVVDDTTLRTATAADRRAASWTNAQVSYRRTNETASISQDLWRGYKLSLGYDDEIWTRANRDTGRTDEESWKLALDATPASEWDARVSYLWASRNYDRYNEQLAQGASELRNGIALNPKYHEMFDQANRDRHQMRLNTSWRPTDRWSILSEFSGTFDQYPTTQYGVQFDRGWGYSDQVNYAFSPRSQIWTSYEYDASHRAIRSTKNGGPAIGTDGDWYGDMTDGTDTYGLGYSRVLKKGKSNLDLSAFQAFSREDYNAGNLSNLGNELKSGAARAFDFPPVTERLTNINASVNYKLRKDIWGKFLYSWQNYDVADWAQGPIPGQPLQPYMIGSDISNTRTVYLASTQPGYSVNIYQLSASYRF